MPEVYEDKYGRHYMVTSGGNPVAVSVDPQGRAYFIDKAGDLFYDTGNRKIGFYVARARARPDPGRERLTAAALPRAQAWRCLPTANPTYTRSRSWLRQRCSAHPARNSQPSTPGACPAASVPAARGSWAVHAKRHWGTCAATLASTVTCLTGRRQARRCARTTRTLARWARARGAHTGRRAQVDARDNIYNVYMGPDGEPQRVAVGSLGELGTMRVSELGGIPAANLRHAAGERRRGAITAFPDPDAGSVMLPPNTPFTRGRVRPTLQGTYPAVHVMLLPNTPFTRGCARPAAPQQRVQPVAWAQHAQRVRLLTSGLLTNSSPTSPKLAVDRPRAATPAPAAAAAAGRPWLAEPCLIRVAAPGRSACTCTDRACCGWESCETRVGGAESGLGGRTARWSRRGCWRRAASSCRRSRAGGPLASPRTWAAP